MTFAFTTTEWIIVGLVLVLGWVLGLLSSSGGKKWKRRLEEEQNAHAATRAAHAEVLQGEQNRTRELEARNRELESRVRELEQLRPATRTVTSSIRTDASTAAPAITPVGGTTAVYAMSDASRSADDDLGLIRGIGPDGRVRLADDGIRTYRDLETLDPDRAADMERRHGLDAGTIDREQWREQARLLREGNADEHRRRFGG